MKNRVTCAIGAAAIALAAFPVASALAGLSPLLEYGFNPGLVAGGSAAGSAPALALVGSAAIGASGTGVSGLAGDGSLNLTSANLMGGASPTGGRAAHASDFAGIDTLTSFTLAGWFRTDGATAIGNNAGLFTNSNTALTGFSLRGGPTVGAGTLTLKVNNATVTSDAAFGATQQWVFFAVSYDGTAVQPQTNVAFYAGSRTSAVAPAGGGVGIAGPVGDDSQPLVFGSGTPAFNLNVFPFDGFLDNFRIYGSVLTASQLELVRSSDVPAPGACGVAILAIGVGARRRRRA